MTDTEIFNLAGLISNVLGSLILAISLSKYLTSIHGAIAIHDMQINAMLNKREKVIVGDIGNLLKIGVKNGALRTKIGLALIIVGFILQVIPYLIFLYHYTCNVSNA